MKKKLLLTVLAFVCAIICAFGLVACGETPDNSDGGDQTQTVAVESVTLNKTTLTLEVGSEETLTATVAPDNATNKDVTWSVVPASIVTVDNNGKVTAVAAGTATVTATTVNNKTATCSITVKTPAPTTTVTAEEWAEILTSAQSSLNFTMTLKDKDVNYDEPNSDGDIQFPMTIEIDGLKGHYIDGMTLNFKTEAVYVKDGENYYDYEGKDNVWTRKSVSSSEYQSQYESFQSMAGMLTLPFANDFALFRYESGKYVCDALNKPDMQASFVNIEITFENGAVKSVMLEQEGEYGGGIYEIHFGTTTITLPTEYTDNEDEPSAEVTAEQWEQIFERINNFTVETFTKDDRPYETAKFDGSTLLFSNHDGVMIIYTKDGSNYDRYQTFTDEISWLKGYEEASEYDEFIGFAQIINIFKSNYTLFTYDNGVYTLERQTKDFDVIRVTYNKFTNVKITFENGDLIGMEFEATHTSQNTTIKVVISNIESTAITIPTDYTEINNR